MSTYYDGRKGILKVGDRTYNVFGGVSLPLIVMDVVRLFPEISDTDLQRLIVSQILYDKELLQDNVRTKYFYKESIGDAEVTYGANTLEEVTKLRSLYE